MASSLSISLAKIRAEAIRQAIQKVSEDPYYHLGQDFGPDACVGCRWRIGLAEYADIVEHEADDEQGDTNG